MTSRECRQALKNLQGRYYLQNGMICNLEGIQPDKIVELINSFSLRQRLILYYHFIAPTRLSCIQIGNKLFISQPTLFIEQKIALEKCMCNL